MNNIDLVKALHRIWNTGDLTLIERVYAHDFLAHWPPSSEVPERRGIEGIRFGVGRIRTAFPDWHEQVMDVFGSGDRVASRYVSTGTHKGTFWGIDQSLIAGRRVAVTIGVPAGPFGSFPADNWPLPNPLVGTIWSAAVSDYNLGDDGAL